MAIQKTISKPITVSVVEDGKDGENGKDAVVMKINPVVWAISSVDGAVSQTTQDVKIQVEVGGEPAVMTSCMVEDMPEQIAYESTANKGTPHETGSISESASGGGGDVSGDTLLYKVGIGSDWHYTTASDKDNEWESVADIENAIKVFRSDPQIAFIASCGDMGDSNIGDLDAFASTYRRLAYGGEQATRNIRLFTCLGNHDNNLAYLENTEERYTKKWVSSIYGLSYVPGAGGSLAYGTENTDGDMLWLSGALPNSWHITNIDADPKRPNTGPRQYTSDYGKALTREQAESSDYSKLSFYFEFGTKGDVFVFLSPCYGGDGFPLSGEEFINPYYIMDFDNPVNGSLDNNFARTVEQKVLAADIGYTRSANLHYNYQCYRNVDLLALEALLDANPTKRIFIFTHYYFPHLSGGGNQDGYRYDQQNIRPDDWTQGSARTRALCGVQLYFMNYLREKYRNTIWFSGHTHFRWSDGTIDQYQNFCNKNFNITTPQYSQSDVGVIQNNYKRGSDKGTVGGWAVHIPSVSKLSTCSLGSYTTVNKASEGAIMDVYQNHIVIHGLNFKDEGGTYKTDTKDMEVTTLTIDTTTYDGSTDDYKPTGNAIYRITPTVGTVYYKPSGKTDVENEDFSPSGAFTAVCEKITSEGTFPNPSDVIVGYSYDNTNFYTLAVGNPSGKSMYKNTGLGINGKAYFNVFKGGVLGTGGIISGGVKLFSEEISVGITQVSVLPNSGLTLSSDGKTATGTLTAEGTYAKLVGNISFIASGIWNGQASTVRGSQQITIVPAGGSGSSGANGKDGSDGKDGKDGERGKTGRFFYYAGEWNPQDNTTTFSATDAEAPYFKVLSNYWVYINSDNFSNKTTYWIISQYGVPSSNNPNFQIMQNDWKYIITEAIFGEYAHFGSFIINGDWMISQHGAIRNYRGEITKIDSSNYKNVMNGKLPYAWFNTSDPMAMYDPASGSFKFAPNFAVDGLTGKVYQRDSYIRGNIYNPFLRITSENFDSYSTASGILDLKKTNYSNIQIESLPSTASGGIRLPEASGIDLGVELTILNLSGVSIRINANGDANVIWRRNKSAYDLETASLMLDDLQFVKLKSIVYTDRWGEMPYWIVIGGGYISRDTGKLPSHLL